MAVSSIQVEGDQLRSSPTARQPIALAGPTAAGKSAAAMAVARALAPHTAVEIVSVDSALVYRHMDIGTAKPSADERAEVPHHLIDLIEPTQAYSAARFVADAQRCIAQIQARGALPLLVGGTMLYFKALREGLSTLPGADQAVRASLDARAAAEGWPALHAELARVDPATAARLAPHDAQRIQRALEVWLLSGQPLSAFFQRDGDGGDGGDLSDVSDGGGARRSGSLDFHLISLEPRDRAWLHARIAERFDLMLKAGFVDEVRALRARGDLRPDLPSMRCVGYRQAWEALDALQARQGPAAGARGRNATLETDASAWSAFRDAGIAATRQLAKRQLTWLRSMPHRHVVDCDGPDPVGEVVALVRHLIQTDAPS
jgi:tRNA dimethylallyltransferase